MGRAQRANPRAAIKDTLTDGPQNPDPVRLMQRGFNLDHPSIRQIRDLGKEPVLTFTGAAYAVDKAGTFRRVAVATPAPTK